MLLIGTNNFLPHIPKTQQIKIANNKQVHI